MPTLQLYPFRFRDPLTGKWVCARHRMQVPALQRQYAEWELTGAPEFEHITEASAHPFNSVCGVDASTRCHSPYPPVKSMKGQAA